jgi:hypothetical protein
MQFKQCRSCGVEKPLNEFYKSSRNVGGVKTECKACYLDKRKEYRSPTEYTAEQKMLKRSRSRALKKGYEHNIDLSDIFIPDICPLLNIPLVVSNGTASQNSPSLDRIDPNLGYIKGNVWVISNKANSIKNNATSEELLLIATRLADFIAGRL